MSTVAEIAASASAEIRCEECGAPLGHYRPGFVRAYKARLVDGRRAYTCEVRYRCERQAQRQ